MIEIAGNNSICNILLTPNESIAVVRAANNLCRDLTNVCGCSCSLKKKSDKPCNIYIGTIGTGGPIDKKIVEGILDTKAIKTDKGEYHWEGFVLQELAGSLYIAGVGRRGTIFGIYELSRRAGVSPWYYFADVPVKKKRSVSIPENYYYADYPSVKYRGIFLNDEEELNAWAKEHTKDDTIGPELYEHIFELLLRLKANYIWPAMHVNYFNGNLLNGKLANEMGIVVGTSHCDMLLRSNQNEWNPWVKKKGYTNLKYDYSIPGENRERLQEYWQESVEQNKDYEVCYTVGMRGIHDTGFVTESIEQNQKAKVALLEKVITDQREILKKVLGEEQGKNTLQTFVPYKEVLPLYDDGLNLPDDVTLIWVDDNHGYMRRYPNEKERMRSGGHGLYYHSSYWAPPPMSYLFINSIPLAHTGNELRKSYESGIRKIWVLNVGALKPLEQDIEFFLQTGWEVGKPGGLTEESSVFTEHWINENFSGNHGKEAAQIYHTFAQVTNVRKIEHMDTGIFSQTAYGNEAGRRVRRLEWAFHRSNEIYVSLPEEEKAAFFELFLMKIHASYFANCEFYYADRSTLSYDRGNMQAADEAIDYSRRMMDYRRWMLFYYNKVMMDGKWDRILTPEHFSPPVTSLYPAGKPSLHIGEGELFVTVWNNEMGREALELRFNRYGRKEKYIELGNKGAGTVAFFIDIPENMDWIQVSKQSGRITTEEIIYVTVQNLEEKIGKSGKLYVINTDSGQVYPIEVSIEEEQAVLDYTGNMEADGYVSIPASGFTNNKLMGKEDEIGWKKINHMGRNEGACMMAYHPNLVPLKTNVSDNPYMEYDFHTKKEGEFLLEIDRFLTLDSQGRIRLGISVDGKFPVIVESEIRDEWLGNWKQCVMNDGEKLQIVLPFMTTGNHKLRIFMIDNYVTISKLVIYTETKIESNIGPEFLKEEKEHPNIVWEELESELKSIYQCDKNQVPLPNMIYAAKDFWTKDRLYMENEEYPQKAMGKPRYKDICTESGKKDIIAQFGTGTFEEENGIVAIEAEYALEESAYAYRTLSREGKDIGWTHLQAETDGRTGFAMHVNVRGVSWKNGELAPGMHYQIKITHPGTYHVWLLLRFFDGESDSCYLALDNCIQPLQEQLSGGNLFTYSTTKVYFWSLISDLNIDTGIHTFTILAAKSALRIDRIYLTKGEERPALDADWKSSNRTTF